MGILRLLVHIDYQTYWGIFFFGLIISSTAMSTGIDGAIFWEQVLFFVFGVDPVVAIACAICIEVFGFGSGVYGYARKKKIQYREALYLLLFAVPLGILGAAVSKILPVSLLVFLMGTGCIVLAVNNLYRSQLRIEEKRSGDLAIKHKKMGAILSMIGGFFSGAIGVGIGETDHYYLMIKNRYPVPYTSGTSVFMVAITAVACTVFNIFYFKTSGGLDYTVVYNILAFAIPAVLIGARIGVYISHKIERRHFNYYICVVFIIMAVISFKKVAEMYVK